MSVRLTKLKHMFNKIGQWLNKFLRLLEASHVRYTSVPLWKPWRDF